MPALLSSPRITFMATIFLCATTTSRAATVLYTQRQPPTSNNTLRPMSLQLNITVIANNESVAGEINKTTFTYGRNGTPFSFGSFTPDVSPIATEMYNTFSAPLTIWFRNSRDKYGIVDFSMHCNKTGGTVTMSSPPNRTAMVIHLPTPNESIHLYTVSYRQCLSKISALIVKRLHRRIRKLLSKMCPAYLRISANGTLPRAALSLNSQEQEKGEPYNIINILIAFLACITGGLMVCLYAVIRLYSREL
nr:envelope protein m90 [Mastomys natalensis cytomegalovirus 3]WEG69916.1 envelope protein m90 [Mastomys natalensis cytomegalovirus 3]WEG70056.1 envelope protein m90 [Mastomys natalensis cytomegalovirus 3]WEG70196.1 envelope protein m90 [Mastomys natalensis cytomegalovirus 3]WEG70336.1 envelope protein m90 [Mastomys natalensis cytomegalovirus 3]